MPVGATEPEFLDVRVVCATNRDLATEVREERFRQDLLFRLNTFEMTVPPLRNRLDDIPLLVEYFLGQRETPLQPGDDFLQLLFRHDWPGNVRELRNVIERASVLCSGDRLSPDHLPAYILDNTDPGEQAVPRLSRLDLVEMQEIRAALSASGGEKKAAAQRLGIDRKRLYRKMRRLGLS